jgi:hypothetical protein
MSTNSAARRMIGDRSGDAEHGHAQGHGEREPEPRPAPRAVAADGCQPRQAEGQHTGADEHHGADERDGGERVLHAGADVAGGHRADQPGNGQDREADTHDVVLDLLVRLPRPMDRAAIDRDRPDPAAGVAPQGVLHVAAGERDADFRREDPAQRPRTDDQERESECLPRRCPPPLTAGPRHPDPDQDRELEGTDDRHLPEQGLDGGRHDRQQPTLGEALDDWQQPGGAGRPRRDGRLPLRLVAERDRLRR